MSVSFFSQLKKGWSKYCAVQKGFFNTYMVFEMTFSERRKILKKVALWQFAVDPGKVVRANHHAQMGC